MPPFAYFNFEKDDDTHPVDKAGWLVAKEYDAVRRPEWITVQENPRGMKVAVTLLMSDLIAPQQSLADVDTDNPVAVDKVNAITMFTRLVNEPWRCCEDQTNKTHLFTPTSDDGSLSTEETELRPRIRMIQERVRSRLGGPRVTGAPSLAARQRAETRARLRRKRDLDGQGNEDEDEEEEEEAGDVKKDEEEDAKMEDDIPDMDLLNPGEVKDQEIETTKGRVRFEKCRRRQFEQAIENAGEPGDPGLDTIAIRYTYLIQDPACDFSRGILSFIASGEAYAAATGVGARGPRGGGGGSQQDARVAALDAQRTGKGKGGGGGGDDEGGGRGNNSTNKRPVLPSHLQYTEPPAPWEGHRVLTSYQSYVRMVHAYNPEAARSPLAHNPNTLSMFRTEDGPKLGRPYNPCNPYDAYSFYNAVKGCGAPPAKRTFVRQRFLCCYLGVQDVDGNAGVSLRFPSPQDTYELVYPFNKQACVWGCAFPWIVPPVPVFGRDTTFKSRADMTYSKMLRMETIIKRAFSSQNAENTGSGSAVVFEDFCRRMQHELSQLPDAEARRKFRNDPDKLEQAWNMLCHHSDPNIQSVMRHFHDLDRQCRADGKAAGYSFFGNEVGENTKDFALEPLSNFVLKLMDDCEHHYHAITHHSAILKAFVSALSVFEPRRTLKYSIIMYGTAGTSKSFVMRVVVDKMMCGTVAFEVQDFSAKAFQNDTNLNYSFIVMDELHDRVAGIGPDGRKRGEGDPVWKAWLTNQTIKAMRTVKTDSNQYLGSHTDKELIGSMCTAMNNRPGDIVAAIVDRAHTFEVPEIARKGHNLIDKQLAAMLEAEAGTAIGDATHGKTPREVNALYQKIFGLACIINMYIKMGLLEEPSLLVATICNKNQLLALQKGGAAGSFSKRRAQQRAQVVARVFTILKACVEVFCNRATCPLTKKEWDERSKQQFHPRDFMLVQPYLCSNEQVSALSVTMLLNQWVDPMQAIPLQQLMEHGNGGGLAYRAWLDDNIKDMDKKIPFASSKLMWAGPGACTPAAPAPASAAASGGGGGASAAMFAGLEAATNAHSFMYARFGPISGVQGESKNFLWRVATYISRLMAQYGTNGQTMTPNSIESILRDLSTTKFDAPVYDRDGNRKGTLKIPMHVVRLDERGGFVEVLESWVRATYSDASQNATSRAVLGLCHAHTRARPLLTATQIMGSRGIQVDGDDVILPQFLEVVSVRPNPKSAWVVPNPTQPVTAVNQQGAQFDARGRVRRTAGESVCTVMDADVEGWALAQYLTRCGYRPGSPEFAAGMRAHSLRTTADTMQAFGARDAAMWKGVYPERYIAIYVADERKRRLRASGAASSATNISDAFAVAQASAAEEDVAKWQAELAERDLTKSQLGAFSTEEEEEEEDGQGEDVVEEEEEEEEDQEEDEDDDKEGARLAALEKANKRPVAAAFEEFDFPASADWRDTTSKRTLASRALKRARQEEKEKEMGGGGGDDDDVQEVLQS